MRKISRGFPGRPNDCQVRPIGHFGVVADFSMNEAAPAGREPTPRRVLAQSDLAKIGDAPDEAQNIISRHNFAARGVTAARMRDELLRLERTPPKDASAAATIAMVRIAYPNRALRMKYTAEKTLTAALRLLSLPCSGNKTQLVERISNAFAIPPPDISTPVDMDVASGGGHRGAGGRGL